MENNLRDVLPATHMLFAFSIIYTSEMSIYSWMESEDDMKYFFLRNIKD